MWCWRFGALVLLLVPCLNLSCRGNIYPGENGAFSVDAYPAFVTQSPVTITGSKPASEAVRVDGVGLVAADGQASWSVSLDLAQGDNVFQFESLDSAGAVSGSAAVNIALDSVAPAVVSRSPAPDETDVALNAAVLVTFSEPVDCTTVTDAVFSIPGISALIGCVDGDPSVSLTPSGNLSADTSYTVTLFSDVADRAGNPMASDVVWQFTTGQQVDTTPPPPPTADDPAPATWTFDATVLVGGTKEAGSSVVSNGQEVVAKSAQTSWQYTFALVDGDNSFSLTSEDQAGNVSVTSTDFVVRKVVGTFGMDAYPTLVNATPLTVTGTKPDGFGVAVDGQQVVAPDAQTTWSLDLTLAEGSNSFSLQPVDPGGQLGGGQAVDVVLDSLAPSVLTRVPSSGQTGVFLNATVQAIFDEPVDCATVGQGGIAVPGLTGSVTCTAGDPTVVFTPDANLAADTTFDVTVSGAIADVAGNAMGADVTWSFTSGQGVDTTPPDPPTIDNPAPPATTTSDTVVVGGSKEAGSSVISGGATIVPKDALDTWSHSFSLQMGDNAFSLTSEDQAGNVSVTSTDFTVRRDSPVALPTVDPVVSPTTVGNQVMRGTKPANTGIWSQGVELVPLNASTSWDVLLSLADGANPYRIVARDGGGQQSFPAINADITYNQPAQVAAGGQVKVEFVLQDAWNYVGDEMGVAPNGNNVNNFSVDIWIEGPITAGEACVFDSVRKMRRHTRYVKTVKYNCGGGGNPAPPNPCNNWWGVPNYRSSNFLAALIEHGQWANSPEPLDPQVQRVDPATGHMWEGGVDNQANHNPLHPELYYDFLSGCCGWVTRPKMFQAPLVDAVTEATVGPNVGPGSGPTLGTWSSNRTYRWNLQDYAGNRVRKGPHLINVAINVDRAARQSPHYTAFRNTDLETCWDDPSVEDLGTHRVEVVLDLQDSQVEAYLREEGAGVVDSCRWTDQPFVDNRIKCSCSGGDPWPCPLTPISDPGLVGQPVRFMVEDAFNNPGDGQDYAARITYCPGAPCP